ncbi:MAG: hypothetical protein AAF127_00845 [Pseudomonadota bacterium]
MTILRILALTAIAVILAASPPAKAQNFAVSAVGFFERANTGPLSFSAVNIFYDDRCVDPELCFRSDDMAISVVLFGQSGLSERIMRLGRPVRVPGGTLLLAGVGAPPSPRGATPLDQYRLTFIFTPDRARR